MELFYIPKVLHNEAVLEGEELHHVTRVLRKRQGETIHFTDGMGARFSGVIGPVTGKEARITITAREQVEDAACRVTVATALTKNMKRMEWAFEKMTELGVHQVIPLICKRSERASMPRARVEKILTAAMKQSERLWRPQLSDLVAFEEVVPTADAGVKYLAHRSDGSVALARHYTPGSDVLILIGPEGDFSHDEVRMAVDSGCLPVHFGENRLRTETAAVYAVAAINTLNSRANDT
ncbi:MAG: RsmE family RNA methyltransferase [Saprospiraceae bacterium]|nr:RsmE family RNA methyltransferase [Saprospiraceae bacterium]